MKMCSVLKGLLSTNLQYCNNNEMKWAYCNTCVVVPKFNTMTIINTHSCFFILIVQILNSVIRSYMHVLPYNAHRQ